jgi:hypothetical protein
LTGASLLLGRPIKLTSRARTAELVGSNVHYIEAAITVLKTEDPALIADVLAGHQSLLAAAAKVRQRADLIAAYRKATLHDRKVFGSTVGVDKMFDETIVPSL